MLERATENQVGHRVRRKGGLIQRSDCGGAPATEAAFALPCRKGHCFIAAV